MDHGKLATPAHQGNYQKLRQRPLSGESRRASKRLSVHMDPYAPRGYAPEADAAWAAEERTTLARFKQQERAEATGLRGRIGRLGTGTKQGLLADAGAFFLAAVVGLGVRVGIARARTGRHQKATGTKFEATFGTVPGPWKVGHKRPKDGALASVFRRDAVASDGAKTTLAVLAPCSPHQPCGSGQLAHDPTFLFGHFTAELQVARGQGVVTAFQAAARAPTKLSQAIVCAFEGQDTHVLWATTHRDGKKYTQAVPLPFDAAQAPHTYAFVWQPNAIQFFADAELLLVVDRAECLPRPVPAALSLHTGLLQTTPATEAAAQQVAAARPRAFVYSVSYSPSLNG